METHAIFEVPQEEFEMRQKYKPYLLVGKEECGISEL
jgi:hypothetical protein